jgi:uncharacterized protein (TIGR02118 family)
MIKLSYSLRRLPSLSRSEFQLYWRETHAPLVQQHAAALRIRRYVQLHCSDDAGDDSLRASRGAPEGYDGVAELWWDSFEDMAEAGTTAEGRAAGRALSEDEKRFIDLAHSPFTMGIEHPIIGDSK